MQDVNEPAARPDLESSRRQLGGDEMSATGAQLCDDEMSAMRKEPCEGDLARAGREEMRAIEDRIVLGVCSSSCPYCRSCDELPAEEDHHVRELRKVVSRITDAIAEQSRELIATIKKTQQDVPYHRPELGAGANTYAAKLRWCRRRPAKPAKRARRFRSQ
jgi:hypothetical protein